MKRTLVVVCLFSAVSGCNCGRQILTPVESADAGRQDAGHPVVDAGEDAGPTGCTPDSTDLTGCPCANGGAQRSCYPANAAGRGVGVCHDGVQTCVLVDGGEQFGPCLNAGTPTPELCTDGLDNDCNGLTDCQDPACLGNAACVPICTVGQTRQCYDGPPGTQNVGICHGGTQTCIADGTAWDACDGGVGPQPEAGHCTDGIDNDCNGKTDCADPACSNTLACPSTYCSAGGHVDVDNLWYCSPTDGLCSTTQGDSTCCTPVDPWSSGGSLTVRCAGNYTVCARTVSMTSGCTVTTQCVTVSVNANGDTVSLPRLPGFYETTACAAEAWADGGFTCLDISGTPALGGTVNVPSVVCGWYFCGSAPGTQCGSGPPQTDAGGNF